MISKVLCSFPGSDLPAQRGVVHQSIKRIRRKTATPRVWRHWVLQESRQCQHHFGISFRTPERTSGSVRCPDTSLNEQACTSSSEASDFRTLRHPPSLEDWLRPDNPVPVAFGIVQPIGPDL
jgi:hypothetical protein